MRTTPPPELRELEEQTAVGALLLRALMRRQLRLSLRLCAGFVVLFAIQPLVGWFWPAYGTLTVLTIPVPWLILGLGTYPVLIGLGFRYVQRANAIDEEFAELLQ